MRLINDYHIRFIIHPAIVDERRRLRNGIGLVFTVQAQFGRDLLIDFQLLIMIDQQVVVHVLINRIFRRFLRQLVQLVKEAAHQHRFPRSRFSGDQNQLARLFARQGIHNPHQNEILRADLFLRQFVEWRCLEYGGIPDDLFHWKQFLVLPAQPTPDFRENRVKFVRSIIIILLVRTAVVDGLYIFDARHVQHQPVFDVQRQGFVEMIMPDHIHLRRIRNCQTFPIGPQFEIDRQMLHGALPDIGSLPDIDRELLLFTFIVDDVDSRIMQ